MSNPVITIIDYKAGNLASVRKAVAHLGYDSVLTDDPDEVRRAERILLPGVGHFRATRRIADSGLKDSIFDAIARGVPFMGICVGMQWLHEGSTEAPETKGLGLLRGTVERFESGMKVPHVGWNTMRPIVSSRLLRGIPEQGFVYYTHSYRCPVVEGVVATTTYGEAFAAAVEKDNVFGVQFHPEKSSDVGLQVLKNFFEVKA